MLRTSLTIAAIALAAPAFAQTAAPTATPAPAATATASTAPAATPAKPNVATGAQVVDTTGAAVGTIEGVTNGVATLNTGTTRAGVPVGSFAANGDKLVLALTKAQVDAQGTPVAAGASASATPAAGGAAAAGATPTAATSIAVGAQVKDQAGATVGTVKAVNGNMVTVASATASAQLPKTAFATSGDSLVIGLTAAQFEAAAKQAGGAKAPASKG